MKFDLLSEFIDYIKLQKATVILSYDIMCYNGSQFWDLINIYIVSDIDTIHNIIDIILKSDNMNLEKYKIDGSFKMVDITFYMKDALKRKNK